MNLVEFIRVHPNFGGHKHTMVQFTNGSTICSCKMGFKAHQIPSLRYEENP